MRFSCFAILFLFSVRPAFAFDDNAIVKQCDVEWGADFKMVKYCRDQQRKAGRELDAMVARSETDKHTKVILDKCVGEWATNYKMVVYCHDRQLSALTSFSNKPWDVPDDIYKAIGKKCEADWGIDYAMIEHCIAQQSNAWRSLQ